MRLLSRFWAMLNLILRLTTRWVSVSVPCLVVFFLFNCSPDARLLSSSRSRRPAGGGEVVEVDHAAHVVGKVLQAYPRLGAGDADADGQANAAESVAGTDPRDAASLLRVIQAVVDRANGEVHLTWSSVPGRQYTVQSKASLDAGDWTDAGTRTATADTSSLTVPAQGGTRGFYRVIVGD